MRFGVVMGERRRPRDGVSSSSVHRRPPAGRPAGSPTSSGLDEDRLRFYQLCMHLGLVAGPLQIAGTSHPEREWFRNVAGHHLQRALQFPA
jgi:hypothetical protein